MTFLVVKQLQSTTENMEERNCAALVPGDAMLLGDGDLASNANGGFCQNRKKKKKPMCNVPPVEINML